MGPGPHGGPGRVPCAPGLGPAGGRAQVEVERDLWLYIDVDLGPAVTGRTLTAFGRRRWREGAMQSLGRQDGGQQMSMFGVPVAPTPPR